MGMTDEKSRAYSEAVQKYEIFDAAMWWDPWCRTVLRPMTDWDAQLRHMEERGINGALVTVADARTSDARTANEGLADLLKGHANLRGCMVATPEMFMTPDRGSGYLRHMRDIGVAAARIFPGEKYHSVKEYALGRMCEALEKEGMPLIVWHIDTPFDAIDRICADHPGLNVMLDSLDRKLLYHARDYMSLLLAHRNFYLETHNLVLFNEYDVLDEVCGASDRLVYGSWAPYAEENFSIYPIYASGLSEEKKQAIFAGNAKRLFGI